MTILCIQGHFQKYITNATYQSDLPVLGMYILRAVKIGIIHRLGCNYSLGMDTGSFVCKLLGCCITILCTQFQQLYCSLLC